MLKTKFADKEKYRIKRSSPRWIFDGKPIQREWGMIYWYSWNRHTLDIRVIRKILSLPAEHPADFYFSKDSSFSSKDAFDAIFQQIQDAIPLNTTFRDIVREHDRILDEE